jgi:hypothetical protein
MEGLIVVDTYGRTHQASLNEYNVALALQKLELRFMFQVEIFGGKSLRGGQVLDFLVWNPFPIPLQVFGDYYHTAQLGANDNYNLALLRNYYGREVEIIWGTDSKTPEDALSACSSIFS